MYATGACDPEIGCHCWPSVERNSAPPDDAMKAPFAKTSSMFPEPPTATSVHVMPSAERTMLLPLPAATNEAVERVLYTGLSAIGGSFSAEHGVGSKKRAAFERYADPVKRQLAQAVKTIIDPEGLLNPGKIVDPA